MTDGRRNELVSSRQVWRSGPTRDPERAFDDVAVEEPVEIRVGGRPVSVTMRTPGHDEDLALGFLVGEGLITGPKDVVHIRRCSTGDSDAIDVLLAPHVTLDFARLTRHVFASSSCGVCGTATIDAIRAAFPPVPVDGSISADTLLSLPGHLERAQAAFARTGGMHAAGLFDPDGRLAVAREDVGRHNAVDKVVGHSLRHGMLPLKGHTLMVSGRASFEIVQKALGAGLAIVAAVSAPSSLAIDLAEESNITLIGFLRGDRFNIYTHPGRVNRPA